MHLLIVAATAFELAGVRERWPAGSYASALTVSYLESGVGPILSAVALTECLLQGTYDLVINVGVAGAFDRSLTLGQVVHVTEDYFGDVGVEERDGTFTDMFSLGLAQANDAPFAAGRLQSGSSFTFAKQVSGVTNSTVHGSQHSIDQFTQRSDAQVESMEGASVAFVALRQNIAHLQLRAISNYVEPRNRDAWKIKLALTNLTDAVDSLLSSMPGATAAQSARLQLGL